MPNQLLLGSGAWHWPEWVTVDANPAYEPTYIAALPALPTELFGRAWDTIMMIHCIEHLPIWEALDLLRDCHRLLAPGGTLILEQPDIHYAAKVLLGAVQPPAGAAPGQFDMWALYGDPTHRDVLMLHRWGYTPDTLTDLVAEVGFARDQIAILPARYHQPIRDFRLEAIRS